MPSGGKLTQRYYAQQGIITEEMEYVALREQVREECTRNSAQHHRDRDAALGADHAGAVRREIAEDAPSCRRTSITPKWSP